jgi:hypothetical protein
MTEYLTSLAVLEYHQTSPVSTLEGSVRIIKHSEEILKIAEARKQGITVTLQKRSVFLTQADLPVELVRLDPANQRLAYKLSTMGPNITETDLERELWGLDAVKALKRNIEENGGLINRVIVSTDGVVREGNCRTVAYRRLHEAYPDLEIWSKIPAVILPPNIEKSQIDILLGEMHVAGINEWKAFEIAAYVHQMHEAGFNLDFLSVLLRKSKSKIQQLKDAYMATLSFLKRNPREDITKYSFFEELLKRQKALKEVAPDWEGLVEEFEGWVVGDKPKLVRAINVRDLPEILASEQAKGALSKGYSEAVRVLASNKPEIESDLFAVIVRATGALCEAPMSEIEDLRAGNEAKRRRLKDLHTALGKLAKLAECNLEDVS